MKLLEFPFFKLNKICKFVLPLADGILYTCKRLVLSFVGNLDNSQIITNNAYFCVVYYSDMQQKMLRLLLSLGAK